MKGQTVDNLVETLLENIAKIDTTSIERKDLQIQMVEVLEEILAILTELNNKIKDKS